MKPGFLAKLTSAFFVSCAWLLVATAGVKLVSVVAHPDYWARSENVLYVRMSGLLLAASVFEAATAVGLLRVRRTDAKSAILLWLCAVFGAYRLLALVEGEPNCPCLGTLSLLPWAGHPWIGKLPSLLLFYWTAGAILCLIISKQGSAVPDCPAFWHSLLGRIVKWAATKSSWRTDRVGSLREDEARGQQAGPASRE